MPVTPYTTMQEILHPSFAAWIKATVLGVSEPNRLAPMVFVNALKEAMGDPAVPLTDEERNLILSMLFVTSEAEFEVALETQHAVEESTEYGATLELKVFGADFRRQLTSERMTSGELRAKVHLVSVARPDDALQLLAKSDDLTERLPQIVEAVSSAYTAAVSAKAA